MDPSLPIPAQPPAPVPWWRTWRFHRLAIIATGAGLGWLCREYLAGPWQVFCAAVSFAVEKLIGG